MYRNCSLHSELSARLAKMMKNPDKGQKDMLIVSGQTHAVKAKAKVRVAQGEK